MSISENDLQDNGERYKVTTPLTGKALLQQLYNHRAMMAPHQKDRHAGKLLLESITEIERLVQVNKDLLAIINRSIPDPVDEAAIEGKQQAEIHEEFAAIQDKIILATVKENERLTIANKGLLEIINHPIPGPEHKPQFDPDLTVPAEILEAAYKIGAWAVKNGLTNWKIGPVQERKAP